MTDNEAHRANLARAMRVRHATDVARLAERLTVSMVGGMNLEADVHQQGVVAGLGAALATLAFGLAEAHVAERERRMAEAERKVTP